MCWRFFFLGCSWLCFCAGGCLAVEMTDDADEDESDGLETWGCCCFCCCC